MSSKDPRRVDRIHHWGLESVDPDQFPPDYFALLSLVLGFIGVVTASKAAALLGLFFSVASVANVQKSSMDIKQLATSVLFSIVTVVMIEVSQNSNPLAILSAASSPPPR